MKSELLFIHPTLAYGALTTLPPCINLTIKIHLLDIDETSSWALPPLTSLDFSWLQDPAFVRCIEESIQQQPLFAGAFYRKIFEKIEGSEKMDLITKLDWKKEDLKSN